MLQQARHAEGEGDAVITCRFEFEERYDIVWDAHVMHCKAITNIGTYDAQVQIAAMNDRITPGLKRAARDKFKENAMRAIESGDLPREIEVSLDDAA